MYNTISQLSCQIIMIIVMLNLSIGNKLNDIKLLALIGVFILTTEILNIELSRKIRRHRLVLYLILTGIFGVSLILLIWRFQRIDSMFLVVLSLVIIFWVDRREIKLSKTIKIVYMISLLITVLSFYMQMQYMNNIYDTMKIFVLDKNYTALLLLLLFMISKKLNFTLLSSIILILGLITKSRGFLLSIIVYYIIKLFNKHIHVCLEKCKMRMYKIFIIMTLSIYLISLFWVNLSNQKGLDNQGLLDESNYVRTSANLYVIEMIKDDPTLLIMGYDSELKRMMRIDDDNYDSHPKFNNARIVQPHNFSLNLILKIGLVQAILYLGLLGKIIDKYMTRDNLPYIFAYLINALILHSTLTGVYLVVWIIMLKLPQSTKSIKVARRVRVYSPTH